MSSSSSSIDGIEISPAREQPSAFASAGKNETFSNGAQPHHSVASMPHEAPPFRWASLWEDPVVNPINLKSYTLPIFNLRNPYTINFHLAWLGFFCAFLSWFAFPALGTSIKADLKLTQPQFGNSNVIALCATLVLRLISGPIVDRFGPRKTMAAILVLGAIPSGLAGTVTSYEGLLVLRFFIGILGASFVPCLVWTTCFFDKSCVGTANALVGGWGNMGGGVTYVVMVALYAKLHETMSQHVAWRVAFAVVPVPILLFVAALTLIFGTDHPTGKWANRHTMPATAAAVMRGHTVQLDASEQAVLDEKKNKPTTDVNVQEVDEEDDAREEAAAVNGTDLDVAVNEVLTLRSAARILSSPLTWLPALAYMSTFGFELAVDSNLHHDLLLTHPNLGDLNAGYLASIFGFLNLFTRPLGGIMADILYKRWGVKSKVYFTLLLGVGQGVFSIAMGFYVQKTSDPSLAGIMIFIVIQAFFNEMANGANYALVPHINPSNNGVMSGLVGSFGNVGGILFAVVWRFRGSVAGVPWWISGIIALGINCLLLLVPKPKA